VSKTSLYRRHRPQAFAEVVGQEHVVRTLSNAVERDRVHHAYLFVGSRGTGKTSLAKILARSLNCVDGPTLTPCGKCESCRAIAAGTSLDVIEMDAASNRSVEDIRDLRERVGYAPAAGRWKVYILDEAHMLTREAWNAFLKTLEEPPPNTVFVLATTEPHKVMATIVDRCQRFDFQRPSLEQLAEVVQRVADSEGIEVDDGAVAAIARSATGSFRDALGTLDQLVAYGDKKVATEDVLAVLGVADAELLLGAADAIAAADGRAALEVSEALARSGRDPSQFGRDLLAHLRQLLVIRTAGDVADAFTVTAAGPERLKAQADSLTDIALARAIDVIAAALAAIREGDEARMTMELALLRAARPQLDPTREALMERIERLEAAVGAADASTSGGGGREGADPPRQADITEPAISAARGTDPSPASPDSAPDEAASSSAGEDVDAGEEEGPVAVASAIDIEGLREKWPAVVEQVRQGSEFLSTVFEAARPVAVDIEKAVVELGFPASAAFNKRKAEAAEAKDRVTEAVRAIVGERLHPVYVMLEGEAAEPEPISDEDLIEKLKSEFDAEEFEVEDTRVAGEPAPGMDAALDAGVGGDET
jgi:DNA polymerase-3 subunit gamma/tau